MSLFNITLPIYKLPDFWKAVADNLDKLPIDDKITTEVIVRGGFPECIFKALDTYCEWYSIHYPTAIPNCVVRGGGASWIIINGKAIFCSGQEFEKLPWTEVDFTPDLTDIKTKS